MTKKKKVLTAGAAFAVAAAALTPVASVDAAQKRVIELAPMTFTGGEVKLPAKVGSSKITWYKSGIDMKKVNTWQTVKGFAGSKKVPTTIKIKIANYVVGFQQSVAPQEVEVDGKLVLPAKLKANFAAGAYFVDVKWEDAKTDKAGDYEVKGTYTRDGKTITVVAKYSVVDADLKIENVSSSVDQAAEVLSVKADVKNLKDGEKVELVVFAGRDMNAPLPAVQAEVKEGKLTVKSAKLPAGNHSFILRSGEVKTDAVNFTVEAPMVKSIEAVSAKRVEVNFNKSIDPASLFANGTSGALKSGTVLSLTTLAADNVPVGTLSYELINDGKTILVTTQNAVSKRYDVNVNGLSTKSGDKVAEFKQVVSFNADTIAPSVVSTSKPTAGTVKVVFSEPLSSLGNITFKKADGTPVSASATGVSHDFGLGGKKEVTFTLGSDVLANETVVATLIGGQDEAGNLFNPNPLSINLYKGSSDGVAPTIASINQTGATTFAVKFSEELQTLPTVTVAGVSASVAKDDTDSTKYIVTTNAPLNGATTVAVSNFTDLSGVAGTPVSRVVNFVKDSAAPKVTSSKVAVDSTNKKEYLELTFDKDVILGTTPTVDGIGSYLKDFVTTDLNAAALTATPVSYKSASDKKVVRVELDAFLGTTTDVKDAVYTLDLTFADVESAAKIAAESTRVSFKRGEDSTPANTAVVGVRSVSQGADNDKVEVEFDKAVDGASATNLSNYSIAGASIQSITLLPVDSGTQTVVLNLVNGSNGFTGVRNITINNVKALGSTVTMSPYFTNQVSLKENVKPVITSAKLTATDKITVTFSEAVINATKDANDFELYIGGVKVSTNDVITTPLIASPGSTSAVLELEGTLTAEDIAKGLVIKTASSINAADFAGNLVSIPNAGVVVTQ